MAQASGQHCGLSFSEALHMCFLRASCLCSCSRPLACLDLCQEPDTALPSLVLFSILPPYSLLSIITTAFLISFHACKLKTKTKSHVLSLSYFFSSGLSCLFLFVLSMSHSLQNLHQLKQIQTLKQMNEQLQAENRALTRVVARLSESIESSDTQEL